VRGFARAMTELADEGRILSPNWTKTNGKRFDLCRLDFPEPTFNPLLDRGPRRMDIHVSKVSQDKNNQVRLRGKLLVIPSWFAIACNYRTTITLAVCPIKFGRTSANPFLLGGTLLAQPCDKISRFPDLGLWPEALRNILGHRHESAVPNEAEFFAVADRIERLMPARSRFEIIETIDGGGIDLPERHQIDCGIKPYIWLILDVPIAVSVRDAGGAQGCPGNLCHRCSSSRASVAFAFSGAASSCSANRSGFPSKSLFSSASSAAKFFLIKVAPPLGASALKGTWQPVRKPAFGATLATSFAILSASRLVD
jgi:hypothetical protein